MLELWQQLTSSTPGLINRRGAAGSSSSAPGGPAGAGGNNKKMLEPVDDFVNMEYDLAGDICALVDAALSQLKKVSER